MLIFFQSIETNYIVTSDPASFVASSSDPSATTTDGSNAISPEVTAKYKKDNKTVRGHMLNHMTDKLFDLFIKFDSAKDIWDMLEKKYGADGAGKTGADDLNAVFNLNVLFG